MRYDPEHIRALATARQAANASDAVAIARALHVARQAKWAQEAQAMRISAEVVSLREAVAKIQDDITGILRRFDHE